MKRFMTIVLIIMQLIFCTVNADYNPNPLNVDIEEYKNIIECEENNAAINLWQLDIANKSLDEFNGNELICRRNALEMAYLVYNRGSRLLCSKEEAGLYANTLKDGENTFYDDVEPGTYDFYLAYGLTFNSMLFQGRINDYGTRLACFDEFITYNEALIILTRLLILDWRTDHVIRKQLQEGGELAYYSIFCDLGLINSNTLLSYSSVELYPKNLNDYIPACQCMLLLNNILYVPVLSSDDFGVRIFGFRYIDVIHQFKTTDFSDDYIYIM